MSELRTTPLTEEHRRLGAKLVDFGGWLMPLHYQGILHEHLTVRQAAGVFDISHMGELEVSGPGATEWLNQTLTNDVNRIQPGQGQYTLLCAEDGGTLDDLYLYRLQTEHYLLVVNASRIAADLAWLKDRLAQAPKTVHLQDLSSQTAALALQGPKAEACLLECIGGGSSSPLDKRIRTVAQLTKNQIETFPVLDQNAWVARTGYTGEDGFEIFSSAEIAASLWKTLLSAGRNHGLEPCGLGARDTLRTEMGYPLYGHELSETRTPIEAGVGFFVDLGKPAFPGRSKLANQKASGPTERCVAFKVTEKAPPPRPGYVVWTDETDPKPCGVVTSGTLSPSLNTGIGMAYVAAATARAGTKIAIEIRGRKIAAELVRKPIFQKAD